MQRREVMVGLGGMLLAAILTIPQLATHHGDPSVLLRVGAYSASRSFIENDIADPVLTDDFGHDGQQFYVIARTFPDLRDADGHLDQLRYRARRILFPALVAPFPAGSPTVWAMYAVNLLAVGAAAVAAVRIARSIGAPDWIGLLAGASPALVESLQGSLADALAFALALWGVAIWRRSTWLAVGLFCLAALTRESSLVAPAACMIAGRGRTRLAMLTPFVVYLCWTLAVSVWLPDTEGSSANTPLDALTANFARPFAGWIRIGITQPGPLVALVLVTASLLAAWVLRQRLPELALWLTCDALLVVISNTGIVERPLNVARVAPLALIAVALALAAPRSESAEPVPAPAPD